MTYVQKGTYAPGETPTYAFCESVTGLGSWHIRKVSTQLFLSGGIDTSSLCGLVRPSGPEKGAFGWDINVKITEHHLHHACPKCVAAYKGEESP